ncbi:MarR family transcriptional regulator [Paenibacillaceae bacterium]|nr:MarR family transcriptional regulator [Paenibacillaceae bacterium]
MSSVEREEHLISLKLFVVLSKAYKSVIEKAIKEIKRYGLSASEFAILEVLYAKGRVPLQQIGEKILITSGTMTYNIDKLEQKGFISRVPCEHDRRVTYAELTLSGTELFDRIFPAHTESIHAMMDGLSPEEKLEAIRLLKVLGKGAAIQP